VARVHHNSIGDFDIVTIVSGAPWNQNCYLIRDRTSGSFVVVDPGFDSAELRASIMELGPKPELLLVTHGHPDHLGAAAAISAWLDVDCRISSADQRIARHAPAYAAAFGGLRIRLPERLAYLEPGDVIELGGRLVEVLLLPGHTPGSLAFAFGDAVLTGDTLFREHVGRTDLPGSDPAAITTSIDRLLAGLAERVLLLAGHGRPWTAGDARDWWTASRQGRASAAAS
jgi:glyoxylase-like metal-dependent hydrolase (beta-lactamase superfamily II)